MELAWGSLQGMPSGERWRLAGAVNTILSFHDKLSLDQTEALDALFGRADLPEPARSRVAFADLADFQSFAAAAAPEDSGRAQVLYRWRQCWRPTEVRLI